MTLDIGSAYNDNNNLTPNTATVRLTRDGLDIVEAVGGGYGVQTTSASNRRIGYSTPTSEIIFTGGQVVNFKTTQGGNNTNRAVVCVWFERLE